MAFYLSPTSLNAAINHLCRYGDTDVFPHLPELAFLSDEKKAVSRELAKVDLDIYRPTASIEALSPKSRYAFRIAHQLPLIDTILLLACVVDVGQKIERKRQPLVRARAFSYRFSPKKTGQLFRPDRTYKHWLHQQQRIVDKNKNIKAIIATDISDFYSRINFHRLENLLDEAAPAHGALRFIKKHLKAIRARQSFGLPVGGSAARLLAELALCDTDQALMDRGIRATRYVDDFRIFLKPSQDPYDALALLAEQLGINEGLSLNAAKTSIKSRAEYIGLLEHLTSDVAEHAEGVALDALTASIYFDDDPDPADVERLKGLNLVELLENELKQEPWDVGLIKVIFRALKITKPSQAIDFVKDRFVDLTMFAKEVCLLMEVLEDENKKCFDGLVDELIGAILKPPSSSVQLIRTRLIEIFVRGIIEVPRRHLKKLETLTAIIDRRQLLLIRGRLGDTNFFRRQKTAINSHSLFELPCLVWGASCLPKDEYEIWLDTVRGHFSKPLDGLFLKWASRKRTVLIDKLKAATIDHPD